MTNEQKERIESAQYHLAGDSIVCGPTKDRGVLTGIFGAMI